MGTAELDLTTEQTEEAACEERTTTFEALYDAVLNGDTMAACAAADLCEEEDDLPCALALRAFAGREAKIGRLKVKIENADDGRLWVTIKKRRMERAFVFAGEDKNHKALTRAKDLILKHGGADR